MSSADTVLYAGRIFPGLRPFEAEDAVLFFGRDDQTDELLRRLQDTHFLAVVGLSGSGKSSLVRAGLLPALRRGHLAGAGPQWRVCVLRPGSDPLGSLARELNRTLGERPDRLSILRSSKLGLADASRYGRKADENLLIVVDQFEELFRFEDGDRTQGAAFVELLMTAALETEPGYAIYIVITLRSDFIGECARFRRLPEVLNESQYLVPRMAARDLREVIQGPAALGGLKVEPGLLDTLIDKTGDDPDQLPILQHLLMQMWDLHEGSTLGMRQYKEVGGWNDALNRHADKVLKSLSPERQEVAKRIFQRLTEKGREGRGLRRPARMSDLVAVAQAPETEVKLVLEHFRQEGRSFLTSPDRELTSESDVDITHESLIRNWQELRKWVDEEATSGEWYRRVADRRNIGGALLVGLELEAALRARELGNWNTAWAVRYADGERAAVSFRDVDQFLDDSEKQRRDAVSRLRKRQALTMAVAIVFAFLAVAAYHYARLAKKDEQRAKLAETKATDLSGALQKQIEANLIAQAEAESNRLLAAKAAAESEGLKGRANQLQASYDAAQRSIAAIKAASTSAQEERDLQRVAQSYYISPYAPGFSLWYGGKWYGRPAWYGRSSSFLGPYYYSRRSIYERYAARP
jgi:conflict system STAND superfamily ATPase